MDQVRNICKEMFATRGYEITSEEDEHIIAKKADDEMVYLFLIPHQKLNMNIIKHYYALLYRDNIKHGILVYQNTITSSVKKILSNNHDIRIEIFCMNELRYNITKHQLVPQHIKITMDDSSQISKFPTLKKSDPVARFYGYVHGDVIKIIRSDGSLYFRVVR